MRVIRDIPVSIFCNDYQSPDQRSPLLEHLTPIPPPSHPRKNSSMNYDNANVCAGNSQIALESSSPCEPRPLRRETLSPTERSSESEHCGARKK